MGLFRLNFDSNNAWIFTQACGDRWPWPLDGPSGLRRGQKHPQRQQGRGGEVRGYQPVRQLLQEQVEGAQVPPAYVQRQAQPWPLPLPRPLQNVLAGSEGHGSPQDREGKGCHEEASDLRGCPTPIRQEEEGHPLRPQGSPAQARQEVLFPRTAEPRRRLEVPGRHRDIGGQAEGQGSGLLQQTSHQGQGSCRRREGGRRQGKTHHCTDRSSWRPCLTNSFLLLKI